MTEKFHTADAAIYHLTHEVKRQNKMLEDMQDDIGEVKTSVAVLESHSEPNRRKKDTAAGGSIGAVLVTVIYAVYEFIKNK